MIEYLTIKMCCLNAAFDDESNRAEIARILRKFADSVEAGSESEDPEKLFDINGNNVAGVEYQYKQEQNSNDDESPESFEVSPGRVNRGGSH